MRSRRRRSEGWFAVVPPVVFGVLVCTLWWGATAVGVVDAHFLPTPRDAISRMVEGLREGYLRDSLFETLREALLGCLGAAVAGIPLGYAIAKSRVFSLTVQPYLAAAQAVPAVAVAPLLTIWIGYGLVPIVILCVMMVVFPVVVGTAVGIRHIDPEIVGAARLDGASRFTLLWHIELPLAAPSILAGLRTGFTLSVTGAVVGEMIIGGTGLGMQLTSAQTSADVEGMFATILLLAFSATAIYGLLVLVERRANYLVRDEPRQPRPTHHATGHLRRTRRPGLRPAERKTT